ncbi:MAG: hypothetical protein HZB44_04605 [Actinobacteria bacterium]|nr:hypothetical protein [Actinomycetota bacterium]
MNIPRIKNETIDSLISDPLSNTTRKERSRLLVVSIISLIVSRGHVPSNITSLGLEFNTQEDQRLILMILLSIQFYFLAAFFVYLGYDIATWYRKITVSILREDENRPSVLNFRALSDSSLIATSRLNFEIHHLKSKRKKEMLIQMLNEMIQENADLARLKYETRRSAETQEYRERLAALQSQIDQFNSITFRRYLFKRTMQLVSGRIAFVRVVFDFLLPTLLGLITFILLFRFFLCSTF